VALDDLRSETVFRKNKITWRATRRNAGGFGMWQGCVKSKQTLTETSFVEARRRMRSFVNDVGKNLGMDPNLIVVPNGSALADTAGKLFNFANGVTGNYVQGAVKVLVSKYLPTL
jgi:phage major head subunit gpT-like protein